MASDIRNKHILDTSAVNWLYRDTRRDELVARALRSIVILPTTLSISEIAANPVEQDRHELLRLLKVLGRDNRPLASPNQLILRACQGYAQQAATLTLNDGDEEQGAWIALNDPVLVDAAAQQMARAFNEEREDAFRTMHERVRSDFQAAFRSGVNRPRNVRALIDHYNRSDQLLYDVVNGIYERAVGRALPPRELRPLIGSLPHWPLFLMGYAYAIFQRAVQEQNFGHRRNPGNIDLWSAAYLASCDCFVTSDTRQRRALKILNEYGGRRARILSYQEWRNNLLS